MKFSNETFYILFMSQVVTHNFAFTKKKYGIFPTNTDVIGMRCENCASISFYVSTQNILLANKKYYFT